jgi:hypothetical protein
MNCQHFERLFALDVEGDLPDRQRRGVEEHLALCVRCRDFAAALQASQGAVKDLREEVPDTETLAAIRARVLTRIASGEPTQRAGLSWRLAYIAAAVVLVIGAVVWVLGRRPWEAPPLPRPVASMPPPVLQPEPRPPVRRAVRRRPAAPKPRPEPLLVKLETSDPNVVIYWIVESGE